MTETSNSFDFHYPATITSFEDGMNPEQLEVIRHTDGPIAVLATAGSGKTRALVHRIARMVSDGVSPADILAVTFSKKAADTMNERLKSLDVNTARVGTWHSLCLQILREDETRWASWNVDDTDKFSSIVKQVMGYQFLNWKGGDPKHVNSYIGLCKANLELPNSDGALMRADRMFKKEAELAFNAYAIVQQLLEAQMILTFDDFLVNVWLHFQNENARRTWSSRYGYLLQDEYQDSNRAQKEIAKCLAQDHRNYMVVGDVAQCIYAFRGSQPAFIMSFAEEWDAKTVIMNRNYRSGSKIIKVANDIIRTGLLRLPTDMIAERGTEGRVWVTESSTPDDEARELSTWIETLTKADGAKLSDFAVLYRTNAQSRSLEEALLHAKIPYTVLGGVSFYDRREVKNLLAYLRVAAGRGDIKDIQRCINAPFRFLGNAFVDRVVKKAVTADSPIDWTKIVYEVSREAGIQDRQRDSVLEWSQLIEIVRRRLETRASDVLKFLVVRTKYIEWLRKDEGTETADNSHADNVAELLRVAEQYETVEGLLKYIDEVQVAAKRNKDKKSGDRVILMSIHRSKGLEFPYVFLAGCDEGLLPHGRGDIEEERRLMYVAVTRAMDGLMMSYSSKRPSRFLVDAGLIEQS